MSVDLKTLFVQKSPRETSGSRSANRFDYQDDWALCKLLEIHISDDDYVLVLDFHDDIVVLDSASNPQAALFYQVKTKQTGFWSRANLLARKKGKEGKLPSILGKLLSNYLLFSECTSGLSFISNAYSNFEMPPDKDAKKKNSKGLQKVLFNQITASEQTKIKDALSIEHPGQAIDTGLSSFVYECSELSLHGHTDHALGVLTNFLDKLPDGNTSVAAAFYRTIKGELSRRATSERIPQDFDELCKLKAIDKATMNEMLVFATKPAEVSNVVDLLRSRLNTEQVSFGLVQRICAAAKTILLYRYDPTNRYYTEAEKIVGDIVGRFDLDNVDSLINAIDALFTQCQLSQMNSMTIAEVELKALIGVCFIERQELQDADQKS